jgi:hypothetical protein
MAPPDAARLFFFRFEQKTAPKRAVLAALQQIFTVCSAYWFYLKP